MENDKPNEFIASLFEEEFEKELINYLSEENSKEKVLEKLLEDFEVIILIEYDYELIRKKENKNVKFHPENLPKNYLT